LPRLEIVWPTVGVRSPDMAPLDAAAAILTQDRTSRLTRLLVYDRQLATNVSASNDDDEDEGSFHITVSPRPGVSLTQLEQLVDSVIGGLGAALPSEREVDRTKRYAVVGTITGLESTAAKADALDEGQTYFGDPLHYQAELRAAEVVTPADVQRVVRQYLTTGRVVLSMVPAGKVALASKSTSPYENVTTASERPAAKGAP
jgi:zinc protease